MFVTRTAFAGALLGLALVGHTAPSTAQDGGALLAGFRDLLPADAALLIGGQSMDGGALVLDEVRIELSWRSTVVRVDEARITGGDRPGDLDMVFGGLNLRNAAGGLRADDMTLDAAAARALLSWTSETGPVDESQAQSADGGSDGQTESAPGQTRPAIDLGPGSLTARNLALQAEVQAPTEGWFVGNLAITGLTATGIEHATLDNLVIYAMGRVQASRLEVSGLDLGWVRGLNGLDDLLSGELPARGIGAAFEDLVVLDRSGAPFLTADRLAAMLDGQPAPRGAGGDTVAIGLLSIDVAAQALEVPRETLVPLPYIDRVFALLPETISGDIAFSAALDGPSRTLTIAEGRADLPGIVLLDGSLSLVDVSMTEDEPRLPLDLLQMSGSLPMFSIAGGHFTAEEQGLIAQLEAAGVERLSGRIQGLADRVEARLPMLAGRLDGIIDRLTRFEGGERIEVRLEPPTPAPAVELISMMLISPDALIARLGLSG